MMVAMMVAPNGSGLSRFILCLSIKFLIHPAVCTITSQFLLSIKH